MKNTILFLVCVALALFFGLLTVRVKVTVNNAPVFCTSESDCADDAALAEEGGGQESTQVLEEEEVSEPLPPAECDNGICEYGEDYFSCTSNRLGPDCAKDPDFDFIYGDDDCVAISWGKLHSTTIVPDGGLLFHRNGRVYYRFCGLPAGTQNDFVVKLYRSLRNAD